MTDNQIIENIFKGGVHMEKCMKYLYQEFFGYVYTMLKRHRLSEEDVLNAYTDCLVQFKIQVMKQKFEFRSKISTYIYSIFNNKCIDIIRGKTTNIYYEENIPEYIKDSYPDIIDILTKEQMHLSLITAINKLGNKCKEILMDWNDGFSMEEIAVRNELSSAHVARSKKYSCLKDLIELVKKRNIIL